MFMVDGKSINLEHIAQRVASSAGQIRTAGKIEFVKDQGPVRRDVRVKGYEWSPDALRDLAKILWAGQRAHSYAMAALRIFSKMPSSEFSPDGLLGGRGYIQSVKDLRAGVANAVETLSSFTDTVHDEINASHWNPVEEKADIKNLVDGAKDVKENPEKFVEEEFEDEEEGEPLVNPVAENPEIEKDDEDGYEDGYEESGSQLPPDVPRTSSVYDRYSMAFEKILHRTASSVVAGGALDESLVPGMEPTITDRDLGGPRAYPLGPASGGEFGNFEDPGSSSNLDDTCMEEQELLLYNGLFLPSQRSDVGDGDDYRLSRTSASLSESYSWLPGSNNDKSMNWYGLGVTEADTKWMLEHCKPDLPKGILPEDPGMHSESLWDGVRIR